MIEGRKVVYCGDTELYYPFAQNPQDDYRELICWDFPLTKDEIEDLNCDVRNEKEKQKVIFDKEKGFYFTVSIYSNHIDVHKYPYTAEDVQANGWEVTSKDEIYQSQIKKEEEDDCD